MIRLRTLTDGGQSAHDIAVSVADFLAGAERSLDLALYDLRLHDDTACAVLDAVHAAVARGVAVRLVYDVGHANPIPVPPPPGTEAALVAALDVPTRAIPGVPDLMHHKFVIRDGEAVLTGSTNWTDDSWSREENVIVQVRSRAVARAYARDLEQLWTTGDVAASGHFTMQPVDGVRAWFAPGRGREITQRIAEAVGRARGAVRVCSPVITAGAILRALDDARVPVSGAYDATQMDDVAEQWRRDRFATWKIPLFRKIVALGSFGCKRSTPYAPGTVHDYMHAKIVIADDVVFVGSYNLSGSGRHNAENVIEAHDADVAAQLATFVDGVRDRYR
jgi:phosphatidylserine/phosphatidylglycerophosphate/cardiolipin synthase-like enzyme